MTDITIEIMFSYAVNEPFKIIDVKKNGRLLEFRMILTDQNDDDDEIAMEVEFNPHVAYYDYYDILVLESYKHDDKLRWIIINQYSELDD